MLRVVEHYESMSVYDLISKSICGAEGYKLDNGITVVYDYRGDQWLDHKGNAYKEVILDGSIKGFMLI